MKSVDIDRHIRELQNTVVAATINYQIWWIYKSADTRPKYIDTMNRYLGFFHVSIHAHFVAYIIALYRFYEQNRRTINLTSLLKALPALNKNSLPADFSTRTEKARDIWKKVAIIRNNCFGHINGVNDTSEMFAMARLRPDDIKYLLDITKSIINDISESWNGSIHAFDLDARKDTIDLLDDLNSYVIR